MAPRTERLVVALLGAILALSLAGCSPKIGDHCRLNTDCGSSGTLVCDTSYPGGYCTQFNCTPDVCQNSAACVELYPAVPGCSYDDYHSPSRTGRSFCLAQCSSNSDCRTGDGYVCDDPRKPPWNAAIIDDVQSQRVCVPAVSAVDTGSPEGGVSVCSVSGPQLPALDAAIVLTTPDAATDSAPDAAADGQGDAAPDAPSSDAADDGANASDAPDAG